MCYKAVTTCPFVFDSIPDRYKTQEMVNNVGSEDPYMLKYCLYKYKTQEMCDKAVNSYLLALNFVPDWFVTNKIIDKLYSAMFSNHQMVLDLDPDFVTLFSNIIGLDSLTLDSINLDDNSFEYCDPEIISNVRLVGLYHRFTQRKACKER